MTGLGSMLCHYAGTKWRAHRFRDRAELESWQDESVEKHLKRILPQSSFYRDLYEGRPWSDWRGFPVIDKSVMMANFDELNTVGIRREEAMEVALKAENCRDFSPTLADITVGLSSGTSGNRGLFLVSAVERRAWAGTILARILPGSIFQRHRAALFLRANSNLYRSVASRRFSFGYFDLLAPINELIDRLSDFEPTLLVAPPSVLRLLAEAQNNRLLSIRPDRIISVAEVLEPQDRLFLKKSFGQSIHQVYQATEGFLGATCQYGTLHLNEDIVVVQKEWLNQAERKFIPVITDFRRVTQPILRYRLNDILTERSTPCPCGSVFLGLDAVEGRCDDLLHFHSKAGCGDVPVFPDFIRRAIITASEAIEEYGCVQCADDLLEVSIKIPPDSRLRAEESIRQNIAELCEALGCYTPALRFSPYIPVCGGTKLRRVRVNQHSVRQTVRGVNT